jgi:hypothetical protein
MNRPPVPKACFLLADGTNGEEKSAERERRRETGTVYTAWEGEREKEAGLRNMHSRFLPRKFRAALKRALVHSDREREREREREGHD